MVIYIGVDLADYNLELLTFLRENLDVFAWTLLDILGIDPTVITYCINIDPNIKSIQQKRRAYDKI